MTPAAPLPALALLRSLLHYNPVTGSFTYLQQRGPRQAGSPAGTTVRGIPSICLGGSYRPAAAVAWALFHGVDPAPQYVIPRDGNPLHLQIANLQLSDEPYRRPNHVDGRRQAGRPKWHRSQIRYLATEQVWQAWHNKRLLGNFVSRPEAIAAKRAAIANDRSNDDA